MNDGGIKAGGVQLNVAVVNAPPQPTIAPHVAQFIEQVNTGLASAIAIRASVIPVWVEFAMFTDMLRYHLTCPHVMHIVQTVYEATKKKGCPIERHFGASQTPYGVIDHVDQLMHNLTNMVLFPHLVLEGRLTDRMSNAIKKNDKDVFELLKIFCDLSQQLDDSKVKDLHWFVVICMMSQLIPNVFSSEGLVYWPKALRNAVAHGQVRLVAFVITAYNVDKSGLKNWELAIEVNALVEFLTALFSYLGRFGQLNIKKPFA